MVGGARRRSGGKICARKTTSFYIDSPGQFDHRLAYKTNINRYPKTCRIMALGCYFPRHGDLFFRGFIVVRALLLQFWRARQGQAKARYILIIWIHWGIWFVRR